MNGGYKEKMKNERDKMREGICKLRSKGNEKFKK